MTNDNELLRRYVGDRSEDAFAALVKRHVDLVHSAAVRESWGDTGVAEDITQAVFVELANKASHLKEHPALAGWLYTCVRRMAANVRRANQRRERREQETQKMNESIVSHETDSDWQEIRPVIDDAMHELHTHDRTAIVLRYFEQHSLKEVGVALGVNENTARMRVNRALEKLQAGLAKRGITRVSSGLAGVVTAGAVLPAPGGLALTVAKGALATASVTTPTLLSFFELMSMSKLKTGLASAVLVASVATPMVLQQQAKARLSKQNMSLQSQLGQLTSENQRLASVLAERENAPSLPDDKLTELMKLRNEVSALRAGGRETASVLTDVTTLQQEVARLESELEKLERESIQGWFRLRADWEDKGNDDPISAVETMLWAFGNGTHSRLIDVTTPQGLKRSNLFPAEHPPVQSIGAVNLISSNRNPESGLAVVVAFAREDFIAPPGGSPYTVNKLVGWRLKETDDGWRVDEKLFFSAE